MAEYIEREALLNRIATLIKRITPIEENRDMFYHDSGWNGATTGAKLEVMNAPAADVVEVVRCKDCKGRNSSVTHPGSGRCLCERKSQWVFNDDFCSYGERRQA